MNRRWPIGRAGAALRDGRPECSRETLFSMIHNEHKTNAAPSRLSRRDICSGGDPTDRAEHIVDGWNAVREITTWSRG